MRSKGGYVKLIWTTEELTVVYFKATSYPKDFVVGEFTALWDRYNDIHIFT
jgi:hypothetical protein